MYHLVILLLNSIVCLCSNWPTFPQIFIKGEFVGGSDIILNMHQASELIKWIIAISFTRCIHLSWYLSLSGWLLSIFFRKVNLRIYSVILMHKRASKTVPRETSHSVSISLEMGALCCFWAALARMKIRRFQEHTSFYFMINKCNFSKLFFCVYVVISSQVFSVGFYFGLHLGCDNKWLGCLHT
jgi:hypothetical protein